MARIRTVKPEFWTAEQVMELSPMARLLFIGMWNFCDDKGVHPVAYKTLKAEVFPADDLLSSDVESMIGELIAHGLLREFEADGRRWWYVTGWHHQVINRPSKSRYPEPPRTAPLPSAAGQGDEADDAELTAAMPSEKAAAMRQTEAAAMRQTEAAAMRQTEAAAMRQTEAAAMRFGDRITDDSSAEAPPLSDDSLSIHGAITEDSRTEGKGREGKGREGSPLARAITDSTGVGPPLADSARSPPAPPTAIGVVCLGLKGMGFSDTNPHDPKLSALLAAGLTPDEIIAVGREAAGKGKGFRWVLATAEGRRRDAAAVRALPPRMNRQEALEQANKAATAGWVPPELRGKRA